MDRGYRRGAASVREPDLLGRARRRSGAEGEVMRRYVVLAAIALALCWSVPHVLVGAAVVVALALAGWIIQSLLLFRRLVRRFGWDVAPAVSVLRSRRRWRTTAANVGLVRAGERPTGLLGRPAAVSFVPRVVGIDPAPYGAEAVIVGAPGQDLSTWSAACGRLASALRVGAVTVSEPIPNRFVLALRARDPLADPICGTDLMRPADVSLVLGVTESGEWAELRLDNHSGIVVCGAPGSGKSAWLSSAIGGLLTYGDIQLLLIDGKGGHDLDCLAPRAYSCLSGPDRSDPLSVLMALRDVQSLMRRRLDSALLWFEGAPNYWTSGPHEAHPVVLVAIDEAQTYLDSRSAMTKDEKALLAEIQSVTMDLIKKGRSAGIVVVLATQKSTVDAIPSAIRDQCGLRVCFRVATREAAEAALGQLPDGGPSPIGQDRGVGVAVSPEVGAIRFRAPFVSSEIVDRVLCEVAALTKDPASAQRVE